TKKFVNRAVELVRPRPELDDNLPVALAVLGRVVVREDFKFLNGVERWFFHRQVQPPIVLVDATQGKADGLAAAACNGGDVRLKVAVGQGQNAASLALDNARPERC